MLKNYNIGNSKTSTLLSSFIWWHRQTQHVFNRINFTESSINFTQQIEENNKLTKTFLIKTF